MGVDETLLSEIVRRIHSVTRPDKIIRGVSLITVDTHRQQIMSKLGLCSVAELTNCAIREGLRERERMR